MKKSPLLFLALLVAVQARGQIGSGWTQQTFSERFEYESNDVLITISPPPASFNNGYCEYDNTAGVETFQLLTSQSNRAETRPNDDYSSGTRQFQADVLISSPSVDECIHQIFNGSTAPFLLLREETNNNGSLKVTLHTGGSASNLATNLYGVWFRLNSINNMNNSNVCLYINGSLVWSGQNPGGTFYTKYGAYGTHSIPAKIQFKNVKEFSGGTTNVPVITGVAMNGKNLTLRGSNGNPGEIYHVLASTNVARPLTNWTVLATNTFDGNGNFNYTNTPNPATPQTFFVLQPQ